ncbi:MAG: hypothetical protein ACPGYF_05100 [Chitinophagales bacterium]
MKTQYLFLLLTCGMLALTPRVSAQSTSNLDSLDESLSELRKRKDLRAFASEEFQRFANMVDSVLTIEELLLTDIAILQEDHYNEVSNLQSQLQALREEVMDYQDSLSALEARHTDLQESHYALQEFSLMLEDSLAMYVTENLILLELLSDSLMPEAADTADVDSAEVATLPEGYEPLETVCACITSFNALDMEDSIAVVTWLGAYADHCDDLVMDSLADFSECAEGAALLGLGIAQNIEEAVAEEEADSTAIEEVASASSSDVLDFLPERTILFKQVEGDLDGDGDNDVVLITKETTRSAIVENDYGDMVDRNRRGLVILETLDEGYRLLLDHRECFESENEDGGVYYAPELYVSIEESQLICGWGHGRYGYWQYIFDYAGGDFALAKYFSQSLDNMGVPDEYEVDYVENIAFRRKGSGTYDDYSFAVETRSGSFEGVLLRNILMFDDYDFTEGLTKQNDQSIWGGY